MSTPLPRALAWSIGGVAALVVVAVLVAVLGGSGAPVAEPTASSTPKPTGTPSPTTDPTQEPTPTAIPTTAPPDGLAFDPARPTFTFGVEEGAAVSVNGLLIDDVGVSPIDHVTYSLSGDHPWQGYRELVGTVHEVPGWGLIAVAEAEEIETGGRPEYVLHFEVQPVDPDVPLVFTSTFPLEDRRHMWLTGRLYVSVTDDGGDGPAALTVSLGSEEIDLSGPAGTTVDVPGWGSLTLIEGDAGMALQTTTDAPVFED